MGKRFMINHTHLKNFACLLLLFFKIEFKMLEGFPEKIRAIDGLTIDFVNFKFSLILARKMFHFLNEILNTYVQGNKITLLTKRFRRNQGFHLKKPALKRPDTGGEGAPLIGQGCLNQVRNPQNFLYVTKDSIQNFSSLSPPWPA